MQTPASGLDRRHRHLLTGGAYPETDQILLGVALVRRQQSIPLWCTYMEARQAGLSPRRGAEGIHLGWSQPGSEADGKGLCVFNATDLVGAPLQRILQRRRRDRTQERAARGVILQRAERVLSSWPVPMMEGEYLPRYIKEQDTILMPKRQGFHSREAFLATWGCLQIHSTGHPARLAWQPAEEGEGEASPIAAFISELAWSLLADRLDLARSAAPQRLREKEWLELLQGSDDRFLKLLTEAAKAVHLLMGERAAERKR